MELTPPLRLSRRIRSPAVDQIIVYEPTEATEAIEGVFPFTLFPFAQPFINLSASTAFAFTSPTRELQAYACGQIYSPIEMYMPIASRTAVIIWNPLAITELKSLLQKDAPMQFEIESISSEFSQRLIETLANGTANEALIGLENLITTQLSHSWQPNERVSTCWQYIIDRKGDVRLSELSELIGISERRVQQLFKQETGTSPKVVCRIIRFQHYLQSLVASCFEQDLRYGFHDDSHFIKDLKGQTGMSPQQFEQYLIQHSASADVIGASPF